MVILVALFNAITMNVDWSFLSFKNTQKNYKCYKSSPHDLYPKLSQWAELKIQITQIIQIDFVNLVNQFIENIWYKIMIVSTT